MATKAADKAIDRRIDAAYRETCDGVQIDIMDIGRIFKVGRECILAGADESTLKATIVAFVETIRKN